MNPMLNDVAEVLISEERLHERVQELGRQISADYADSIPALVCVLKGGYLFLADLTRALCVRHSVDFMAISSYGSSTQSSGVVRILKDLDADISGKDVLVVEDVVRDAAGRDQYVITVSVHDFAGLEASAADVWLAVAQA